MTSPADGPPAENARGAVTRDAWAIATASGAYGLSFGALSVAAGLSVWQTQVLSLAMFTGASQFALVGVLGAGGGVASAVATATFLGLRNAFYGVTLGPTLQVRRWRKALAAQFVIDETTAMAVARTDPTLARIAFWTTAGALFLLWNLGTLLGALAGQAVGDPRTYGLDAAAPAAFLALLWPRLHSARARWVAVIGAVIAVGLVPISPSGVPVLAAALAAVVAGLLQDRPLSRRRPGRGT